MAFFDDVMNALTGAAQSVSNKTKDGVELNRLNSESRSAENELTGTYTQLGRAYVDSEGVSNETIDSLLARAKELRLKLVALEQQKLSLKNRNRCPGCGAVMSKNAKFCSNCGTRMPEPEVPAQEPADEEKTVVTYCPSCGSMRKNSDPYCEICGFCFDSKEDTPDEEDAVIISAPVTDGCAVDEEDEIPDNSDAE